MGYSVDEEASQTYLVLSNQTITSSGSKILGNDVAVDAWRINLIIRINGPVSGTSPTLSFSLNDLDPNDASSMIGNSVTSATFTSSTASQIYTFLTKTSLYQLNWTVTGATPSFGGVYVAVVAVPSALPQGSTTSSLSIPVVIASDQIVPISATSLPLPVGASTASNQTTANTSLASIDTKTPALGQALAAASTPVVLTSLQLSALTPLSTSAPTLTRTDESATVTASGGSGTLDSGGFNQINIQFSVAATSGSGAYIQFHLQTSDDATNWTTSVDTPRLTVSMVTKYNALRLPSKYYRYTWDIGGSTPSITMSVTSTFKSASPARKTSRYFYNDLDLSTLGATSTPIEAHDCRNITVLFARGADGGNNGTVQVFASNDHVNWNSVSGNLAANVDTTNSLTLSNLAWLYYQLQVTAKTNIGTRTLDIQWSAN